MRIATRARRQDDPWLFPKPIRCLAETRNLCGDIAETLACRIGYAERIATDGTKEYCPDAVRRCNPQVYYECKSVGKNGSVIVYENRRIKDESFTASGKALIYWLFYHKADATKADSLTSLTALLAGRMQFALALPFSLFNSEALRQRVRCLNAERTKTGERLGYGARSSGYGDGRAVRISCLRARCDYAMMVDPGEINGVRFAPFPLYTIEPLWWLATPAKGACHVSR